MKAILIPVAIFLVLVILSAQISVVSGQEESHGIQCHHVISVSIINEAGLDGVRLSIIKEAVFSKGDYISGNQVYYKGWAGALEAIGSDYTLKLSGDSNADITIMLTKESNQVYAGFTTVHDLGYIESGTIFIYDADQVPDTALGNVARHEMGHALGLKHLTTTYAIMYAIIPYATKYISTFDLNALKSEIGTGKCI